VNSVTHLDSESQGTVQETERKEGDDFRVGGRGWRVGRNIHAATIYVPA
jgi:N-acetylglucosamine kinase-like BadF-type ATPase